MNIVKLEDAIKRSGYKKQYIAEQLGLTANGLTYKLSNKSGFKVKETIRIKEILELSDAEYFEIFGN